MRGQPSLNQLQKSRQLEEFLKSLTRGRPLLGPVVVEDMFRPVTADDLRRPSELGPDALIDATWVRAKAVTLRFAVETKAGNTPAMLADAAAKAMRWSNEEIHPLVLAPYLSTQAMENLAAKNISSLDLCGNGTLTVPGHLFVNVTGNPNKYPQSLPLNNPYRGSSALVARLLLISPTWPTLEALRDAVEDAGGVLSMAQASKAVSALREDLMIAKDGRIINRIAQPDQLLAKLSNAWRNVKPLATQSLRVKDHGGFSMRLRTAHLLKWAWDGPTSATRHGAPISGLRACMAVTSCQNALNALADTVQPEHVDAFADVTLIETREPGYYFQNDIDADGVRWASPLQSYLELQAGDARMQDAAAQLRLKLLDKNEVQ